MDDNGFFETIVPVSEFAIAEPFGTLMFKVLAESCVEGDSTIFAFPVDIHTPPNGFDFYSEEVEASNRFQLLETNAPVIPAASESVITDQTSVNKPKKLSYTARKPRAKLYV
jgi:hypothetical protein